MENININDTLDEIGLDIECIIKEVSTDFIYLFIHQKLFRLYQLC